ncbi:hypothetical protein H0H92_003139 [Tricholoma furcatifolium]|nr:hypothetical protein H0H92_003139 [Tricholoma furcatifolium]
MSDATGFATGGTSDVLTTGTSLGGSCNTTDPGVAFSFELNSALQQCGPYVINGYTGAVQPVTFTGIIPGGQSFSLVFPAGSNSYTWTANVAAGTSLMFTMVDAMGRNGGTSDITTVGITDDATCLNSLSPSSTAVSMTSTSTPSQTSSTTASPSTTTGSGSGGTSIAAIAGTVIGALVFLAVAITLGLFFLRKRRDNNNSRRPRNTDLDLTYDPAYTHGNYPYSAAGTAGASASPLTMANSGGYEPNPFSDGSHLQQPYQQPAYGVSSQYSQYQASSQYQAYSDYQPSVQSQPALNSQSSQYQASIPPAHSLQRSLGSEPDPFNPYALTNATPSVIQPFDASDSGSTAMSSAQRKAAMAGVANYTPSRFIVHTDVEDELPPPNQDGIVELPPQYSERHGPPPTATAGPSSHLISPLGSQYNDS